MEVRKVTIDQLKPWGQNPRLHQAELALVVKSISHYGWTNPILVQEGTDRIIAGHGRLEAAKALGMTEVPVIYLDLDDRDADAYTIADNRLAELSEWDRTGLKDILESLDDGEFDLDLTGFDEAALEELMTACAPEILPPTGPDEVGEPPEEPITRPGDLIILGRHRLLCGDSTVITDVERLMDGKLADMVWTDPPYGMNYQSNQRTKSAKFEVLKNDTEIIGDWIPLLTSVLQDGAGVYVCTRWDLYPTWLGLIGQSLDPKNLLIWDKGGGGMGDLEGAFVVDFEPIIFAHYGKHKLRGKRDGAVVAIGKDASSSYVHPTQKPVALPAYFLEKSSDAGGIVLDLFGGSGSTMIAAEQTGRTACLMELDPRYCDVIVNRWEKLTGQRAQRPE